MEGYLASPEFDLSLPQVAYQDSMSRYVYSISGFLDFSISIPGFRV